MLTLVLPVPELALVAPEEDELLPALLDELLPHAAINAATEMQAMTTKVRRRWCIA
jgi:hypothetical protein